MKNYKFQPSQATQSFPLPASGFMKIKKLCTRKGCLFTILQLSQESTQSCSRVQQSPSSLQATSSMHCPPFPSFKKSIGNIPSSACFWTKSDTTTLYDFPLNKTLVKYKLNIFLRKY